MKAIATACRRLVSLGCAWKIVRPEGFLDVHWTWIDMHWRESALLAIHFMDLLVSPLVGKTWQNSSKSKIQILWYKLLATVLLAGYFWSSHWHIWHYFCCPHVSCLWRYEKLELHCAKPGRWVESAQNGLHCLSHKPSPNTWRQLRFWLTLEQKHLHSMPDPAHEH